MALQMLTAASLAPLVNSYTISAGPPRAIAIPKASKLASFTDVTVNGKLLKKQMVKLNLGTGKRTPSAPAGGGGYKAESGDGDLHFCLGIKQGQPHIACELQNAKAFLSAFNQAIGQTISVGGFFRCMFEHPGFRANDDAHIFEIHPVRAVGFGGSIQSFNVDIPEQKAIHTWTQPHNLNDQDNRIKVRYDKSKDTLTFTGMDGQDENYIQVSGTVSKVKLNASTIVPASFTFDSTDIGHPIQVYCLQGTNAARQLRNLRTTSVHMIVLRNIDLTQALKNKYVINLLAIDIQAA